MKNSHKHYLLYFLLLLSLRVNAQNFSPRQMEAGVLKAVAKAYPASVRVWGFDTVRNVRTGNQFTAVVVTAEGHMLTAAHVNTPGGTYKVMFPDGKSCIAVGLGEIELKDSTFIPDVAMMKIVGPGPWPFAEMGWSSSLVKNVPVISIAYPETLNQALPTVRFGEIYDMNNVYGFLQSTCKMEPGDSGGPLFDLMGRVVGIHSAVDVSEKANFEVPISLYRRYWTALQQAKTYAAYPAKMDSIGPDPDVKKVVPYAALENLAEHILVGKKERRSSVEIESKLEGMVQKVRATVVVADIAPVKGLAAKGSLLLSKSSLMGEQPQVFVNGKAILLQVLARDKENDLVLLHSEVKLKDGVKLSRFFSDELTAAQLGTFLVSPLAEGQRTSVLGSLPFALPKIASIGYLGAQTAFFGPLILTNIGSNLSSGDVKVQEGDELTSINGVAVNKRADYLKEAAKYWPGDQVTIEFKRDTVTFSKVIVLGTRPQLLSKHPAQLYEGGRSIRHDGFNSVLAHDAQLQPAECGGPVFDQEGRFYGINIARFSRTTSLVMPASVILEFVNSHLSK